MDKQTLRETGQAVSLWLLDTGRQTLRETGQTVSLLLLGTGGQADIEGDRTGSFSLATRMLCGHKTICVTLGSLRCLVQLVQSNLIGVSWNSVETLGSTVHSFSFLPSEPCTWTRFQE